MRDGGFRRRPILGDALFALFLVAYVAVGVAALPYDFRDLCYLFSLEQGRWVMQEWVHPIYVPTLDLLRHVLALFGYAGPMVVPVELLSIAAAALAHTLLYLLARRFAPLSVAAAVAVAAAALSPGFWDATVRPTPYSLTLLFQTLALSLLIGERGGPPARYALAGAFSGIAMGYHASAMALAVVGALSALCEAGDRRRARARILAFAAGMFTAVVACWGIFVFYRDIGAGFFRHRDFWSTFAAIEQVPGTSIYTSRSLFAQIESFTHTIRWQTDRLPLLAILAVALIALLRLRGGAWTGAQRRLLVVAGANFAAIAGFFLINNTHNGLIFASLTLAPAVIALAFGRSWPLVAALCALALPAAWRDATSLSGSHADRDPLLAEVRFLQRTLGPRDVLLVPGTPFPELLYLRHLNVFEVAQGAPSHPSPEVPVLEPGAALRARVAAWRERGGRVLYALGDSETDFGGDPSGAEKEKQIFWRPELAARQRAPLLAAQRAALAAAGIQLGDELQSPRGQRYAEVFAPPAAEPFAAPPRQAPAPNPAQLAPLFLADDYDLTAPYRAQRARYLAALAAALPEDPWIACDVAQLVCEGQPRRDGVPLPCAVPAACAAAATAAGAAETSGAAGCFWGAVGDQDAVAAHLAAWSRRTALGPPRDWGFTANGSAARLSLRFDSGALVVQWQLTPSCEAGEVDAGASDAALLTALTAAQLRDLVAQLPIATVRASNGPPPH